MAAQGSAGGAVTQDTLITIKITVNDSLQRLKLPLRDLGANTLPDKLRQHLAVKPEQIAVFERFSDSAGGFIILDPSNPQVFKTLMRAAKAKLKLRLKATVTPVEKPGSNQPEMAEDKSAKLNAIDSILRKPTDDKHTQNGSDAFDRRSNIGSGIFQFRESQAHARASQQTVVEDTETVVPQPSSVEKDMHALNSKVSRLSLHAREIAAPVIARPVIPWSVYCNECDKTMPDSHFHCSICDGGDYDLCQECVSSGKLCPGEGHWLVKRFFQDGKVVSSSTERVSPRPRPTEIGQTAEAAVRMPGAFTDDTKAVITPELPTRTCNSCVVVLPEHSFVTCDDCDDYDLCLSCHTKNNHGHHPAHRFKPATGATTLNIAAETMLLPGRNVRHNALCDGCDKKIYGIRHKCLACPDWDYCNDCIGRAHISHPSHRFAPIYSPIPDPHPSTTRHFGIYCDGPLCNDSKSYITGVRYKCAVCHDTDYCASCEASPDNHHNRTHPLIKFKTPVRNVSITTENEDVQGKVRMMGDRSKPALAETKSTSTETTPVGQANAATQVHTVAEIKPTEVKDFNTQPIPVTMAIRPAQEHLAATQSEIVKVPAALLNAHFVQDSVADGCMVVAGSRFTQIWTLRNPGPHVWPSGCSVRYVGGDNMLNVDNQHPASVSDLADATESNVVGRPVPVGEEISFKVVLKAPLRLGKSISYWRLKAADGTPFGHRLWCDVTVMPAASHSPLPHQLTEQQQQMLAREKMIKEQHEMPMSMQQVLLRQANQANQKRCLMAQEELRNRASDFAQHQSQAQHQLAQQTQQTQHQSQKWAQLTQARWNQSMQQQHQFIAHRRLEQADAQTQMKAKMVASNVAALSARQPVPTIPSGQPPAYESTEALATRLNALRDEQTKRRAHMLARMNAQREQAQSQDAQRTHSSDSTSQAHSPMLPAEQIATLTASIDESVRKEAAKQKVEHIKAKIMKTREDRANTLMAKMQAAAQRASTAEASAEKVKKIIEEINKDGTVAENEESLEGSQMVFPKLDKESPASSVYGSATSSTSKGKAAYVENEAGEIERSATPVAIPASTNAAATSSTVGEDDFEDLTDDLEVLSADDADSDDGFLTDEEYDVLDASDQETVSSP
nr:protein nbr1 like [Quercus suber]